MSQSNVLVLVGSLRAGSVNRQLAETAVAAAPEGAALTILEGLADVPFYNEDLDVEGASIPAVDALRNAAGDADGFLLVTPEYNGTIPAVLKNAIDWISRPYGVGAVSGKPVAVISASPSGNGAKWAHDDTVKAVGVAGGKVIEDTALSIGGTFDKFGTAHPRENAEVVAQVSKVVADLVDATKVRVDA
ncbi:NAD(P)H-dependent oxidoreductase [Rhodococcus sp. IEGM 1379]|uniref:NAD(P)H-dependent oxidoreductase n=1 Tax=Rhodococcus sp. IEGM 1379 TaxID=3047086 RepID=UPI0024B7AB40|nr:NAD(P)H-dependent oxidoreductase [Rhodococcus sp. IEGM 1379]MDI9917699.1 NAD(P)H-dependent oxidoreductase [Rhodococcus sp. IEGM 1379]